MPKLRKTLCSTQSPCILSLMRLIKTQSKETLINWCVDYAEAHIIPIYEKAYPGDARPREALLAARAWLAGDSKLPAAKKYILAAHAAAREAEAHPAAQAAARAAGQAASAIHMPSHSLGIAFYGTAAAAYDRLGLQAAPEEYERAAAAECAKMEAALRAVAVQDEPFPAKIKWRWETSLS